MAVAHDLVVVRTGVANLASVLAGLRKAGAEPHVSLDAAEVRNARAVVLPGVGAFSAGMESLRNLGLSEILRERITNRLPFLSVCLGLQLLLSESEEGPGVPGLAAVPGKAERFNEASGVRIPQLGWNKVVPNANCALLQEGYAYFANSYRLLTPPPGFSSAMSDHGGPFVAAFESGPVLACQFHPELSGAWGIDLLRRWWKEAMKC